MTLTFVKTCPHCGEKIVPLQLRAYSSRAGLRRQAPCPHCGTVLRWTRVPWWVAHIGGFTLFAGALGFLALLVRLIDPGYAAVAWPVAILGAAAMLLGVLSAVLEEVTPPRAT